MGARSRTARWGACTSSTPGTSQRRRLSSARPSRRSSTWTRLASRRAGEKTLFCAAATVPVATCGAHFPGILRPDGMEAWTSEPLCERRSKGFRGFGLDWWAKEEANGIHQTLLRPLSISYPQPISLLELGGIFRAIYLLAL